MNLINEKVLCNLSFYTKSILGLNLVAIVVASLFFASSWEIQLTEFVRLNAFFDASLLLFVMPVYISWLRELDNSIPSKRVQYVLRGGFITAFGVAMFGLGVHVAANQISYVHQSPIVEFYDEFLGHVLAYVPAFFISLLFMWAQSYSLTMPLSQFEFLLIGLVGVVHGVVGTLGLLESRGAYVSVPVSISFMLYGVVLAQKRSLHRMPIVLYYIAFSGALFVSLLMWHMWYGGFTEPSLVQFGRF